ncbi:MAG TPA: NAD+ synthase [Desulfobulbaceae bacterium]|nr:NAD+ synthase [Desulfobulbaceae bacterium]
MKIALVQTNPIIGAFEKNLENLSFQLARARDSGCHLSVFPELSLCGYPPRDLLERPSFLDAHDHALHEFISQVRGIACVIGVLERRRGDGKFLYNSAFFIDDGKVCFRVRKQLLPTYDVFDERRYFEPGGSALPFFFQGVTIGLSVCEDIWQDQRRYPVDPVALLMDHDMVPDFLINISASPYYHGKLSERLDVFSTLCRRHNLPLIYVNQVGGQDELIFDGHSMVMDATGAVQAAGKGFAEDMVIVETGNWQPEVRRPVPEDSPEQVLEALTLGVADYLRKIGFDRVVIGLSGGIDSAVTAAIACRALAPENVLCVALPSPYTAQMSIDDARSLAENLDCGFELLPITEAMKAYEQILSPLFSGLPEDVTEQNLQARIRGTLLMALSNKLGHLLLSTGNKSEMAVGYCTLYGDMNGGLAVLADVPKVMVYELAHLMNREKKLIPERIITRPPSAELAPDQMDQDDLPPYEILDPLLRGYLEEFLGVEELVERGFERKIVQDVISRIKRNEYKRRQAPMGLKVTSKAFGYGRRYPVAQGFVE